jgi:4,5-DOPA dioxygenase extradiol
MILKRRDALRLLAGLPVIGSACSRQEGKSMSRAIKEDKNKTGKRMPVIFAAHGAPILLDDAEWTNQLSLWAKSISLPRSILMISAHWEQSPCALGATRAVPLVYDFYGFPAKYYETKYPSPGAPELATRVKELLGQRNISFLENPERGLDHGAYVPLVAMYPQANVPVLQISMPRLISDELFNLGQALAPLADEGVLVFGSGFLTHNMRYAFRPGTPAWAREFDAWVEDALLRMDIDALKNFMSRAPDAKMALPTWEHYAPLLVALGAVATREPKITFPITGWWMGGAFTKRSVQFS